MWQELVEVTDNLRRVYRSLASLEQKKHQALVTVDLPTVDALTKEERLLINQVTKLEAKRQGIVLRLAVEYYGQDLTLTMAEVIDLAPTDAMRSELKRLHDGLTQSVADTRSQNEVNGILLRGALNAVNASLNRLGGLSVEPTYGKGGQDVITRRSKIKFDA
jgi:flagellar biosynthesis/type III secretory pathway chaperone